VRRTPKKVRHLDFSTTCLKSAESDHLPTKKGGVGFTKEWELEVIVTDGAFEMARDVNFLGFSVK